MTKTRKQHIEDTASDTMSRFIYYDRKEDEDLPVGHIEEAVKNGEISIDEIMSIFKKSLEAQL